MAKILAADIGGTSSRFGFFEGERPDKLELLKAVWLRTEDAQAFVELFTALAEHDLPFASGEADFAMIAAAGPVQHGGRYCDPPWISWDIDLRRDAGVLPEGRSKLVNDFVAQAYAVKTKVGANARNVLVPENPPETEATIGVIGAGTNLGKAMLVPSGGRYIAVPSEGGHVAFPVQDAREFDFLCFAKQELEVEVLTVEKVVSGKGIALVHKFLTGQEKEPEEITERFSESPETLEWCARYYGRACRDFALDVLAQGGIYIAGGVAAKVPELLESPAFQREFLLSPRHRELLETIAVRVITDEESGLWGAAFAGAQESMRN